MAGRKSQSNVEMAMCRFLKPIPENQGEVTIGSGCILRGASSGVLYLMTTSQVLATDEMHSDSPLTAEFHGGLRIDLDLKLARNVPGRVLGCSPIAKEGQKPAVSFKAITVQSLDNRGKLSKIFSKILSKVSSKFRLENIPPLLCCQQSEEMLKSAISKRQLFCHVLCDRADDDFGSEEYFLVFADGGSNDFALLSCSEGSLCVKGSKDFPMEVRPKGGLILNQEESCVGLLALTSDGKELFPLFFPNPDPDEGAEATGNGADKCDKRSQSSFVGVEAVDLVGHVQSSTLNEEPIDPNGCVNSSSMGEVPVHPNGRVNSSSMGEVPVHPNGRVNSSSMGEVPVHPNKRVNSSSMGEVPVHPNGRVNSSSMGEVPVHPNGRVNSSSMGEVPVHPNERVNSSSMGEVPVHPNEHVNSSSIGEVPVHPNGRVNSSSMGEVPVHPNERVNSSSVGEVPINPDGHERAESIEESIDPDVHTQSSSSDENLVNCDGYSQPNYLNEEPDGQGESREVNPDMHVQPDPVGPNGSFPSYSSDEEPIGWDGSARSGPDRCTQSSSSDGERDDPDGEVKSGFSAGQDTLDNADTIGRESIASEQVPADRSADNPFVFPFEEGSRDSLKNVNENIHKVMGFLQKRKLPREDSYYGFDGTPLVCSSILATCDPAPADKFNPSRNRDSPCNSSTSRRPASAGEVRGSTGHRMERGLPRSNSDGRLLPPRAPPEYRKVTPKYLLVSEIVRNINAMDKLASYLDRSYNSDILIKDWRHLASEYKVKEDVTLRCQDLHSPSEKMFDCLNSRQPDLSIRRIKDHLEKIDRNDVVEVLDKSSLLDSDTLSELSDSHPSILGHMCVKLDHGLYNWKNFAIAVGMPADIWEEFKDSSSSNPAEAVLQKLWTSTPNLAISEIKKVLTRLKRKDVCLALNGLKENDTITALRNNLSIREKVIRLLNKEKKGWKTWEHFAVEFGISSECCESLKTCTFQSPTKAVLVHIVQKYPNLTTTSFFKTLRKLERSDVVKALNELSFDSR